MTFVVRNAKELPRWDGPIVATIGSFDGVHKGHQKILKALNKWKNEHDADSEKSAAAVVISFDPHPAEILGRSKKIPKITTLLQKSSLLGDFGIDVHYVMEFTKELSEVSASDFVDKILFKALDVAHLVIGEDAAVGKNREGDCTFLKKKFEESGRSVEVISFVDAEKQKIGSRTIRDCIAEGSLEKVRDLLGRHYAIVGIVKKGDQRGRTLGFPTANIGDITQVLPANGVYASTITIGKLPFSAVTNIGVRPTFDGQQVSVEAHVIDYQGNDFYGDSLELTFVKKIRDEIKFNSAEDLIAQIEKDVAATRSILR